MPVSGWTIAFQAINFLVLIWLLNRFLYRPVTRMIATRQQQIDNAFAEAAAREQAAEQEQRRYAALVDGIDAERKRVLAAAKNAAEHEAEHLLALARVQAQELETTARRELESQREAAAIAAGAWAIDTAVMLSARLLAAVAREAPVEIFFEHLLRQIRALPEDRRTALRTALAEAMVLVKTAHPLSEADRKRWQDRLEQELQGNIRAHFETDPTLIEGVEMQFPHMVIAHSWRDALASARERMAQRAGSF